MKNIKKSEINLTSGNLFQKLLFVSLPLMLSGILQLLYNAADLIVCGKYGSEHAVAAISSTSALINLVIQLFMGLSVGANVMMARCFGANNKHKAYNVVHTSMLVSLISGIFLGVFGSIFAGTFLKWMGTPIDVIHLSTTYLTIYFMGLPFIMIFNFGAALLRATGNTKQPFYFLAIAGVVNVILNLILVIPFRMDVAGVAIATITSQAISAILILISLVKNQGYCHLDFTKMKIHKEELLDIIKIGLPAGIQGSIFSVSNVLIQSSINSLGAHVMDGNGASSSLEGFVYTCMASIAQSSVAFVSANYGAGKPSNIKRSTIYAILQILLFSISLGGIVILFGKPLLSIYLDPTIHQLGIEQGYTRLVVICSTYFLCGIMDTFSYSLRGMGYSLTPTIISIGGVCVFRIIWIYTIFPLEKFHNLLWLSLSYPISWLITGCINFLFFLVLYQKVKRKLTISLNSFH